MLKTQKLKCAKQVNNISNHTSEILSESIININLNKQMIESH
jgi:hypothetical protein